MAKISVSVQGHSFVLAPGEIIVGRDVGCQLRVADLRVSRRHLRLAVTDAGATVEDLGSANGTYVNSVPLYRVQQLYHGDMIEIGGIQLRISVNEHEDARSARQTVELPAIDFASAAESASVPRNSRIDRRKDRFADTKTAEVPDDALMRGALARDRGARERRRHVRTPAPIEVLYDSDTLNLTAAVHDVSDGGVFVVTELLDQVGTACRMTIALPGARAFRAQGVVRHVVTSAGGREAQVAGMGIEFTELQTLSK